MVRFLETLDVCKELLCRAIAFARADGRPLLARLDSRDDIEAAIRVQKSASTMP